jgi:hypothetical protein
VYSCHKPEAGVLKIKMTSMGGSVKITDA